MAEKNMKLFTKNFLKENSNSDSDEDEDLKKLSQCMKNKIKK